MAAQKEMVQSMAPNEDEEGRDEEVGIDELLRSLYQKLQRGKENEQRDQKAREEAEQNVEILLEETMALTWRGDQLQEVFNAEQKKVNEKDAKIAELEEQLQKLRCEVNGRKEPAKESTKSKIYAFDRRNSKNAAQFDYETNKWKEIRFCTLQDRCCCAFVNVWRSVFITGGQINREITTNCQVINLSTFGEVQTVESFYDLNIERAGHCALSIGDKIYVCGGWNDSDYLSSIECSDGLGIWTKNGNLCEKRYGAAGAVLDGVAYVFGGCGGESYLNSAERFDPREGNKCVHVKKMQESRHWAEAAEHKGLIYVTGGMDRNVSDIVEIYDPRADGWTYGPNMYNGRRYHALVSNGNRLLAIGGIRDETMEELVDGDWTTLTETPPFQALQAISI